MFRAISPAAKAVAETRNARFEYFIKTSFSPDAAAVDPVQSPSSAPTVVVAGRQTPRLRSAAPPDYRDALSLFTTRSTTLRSLRPCGQIAPRSISSLRSVPMPGLFGTRLRACLHHPAGRRHQRPVPAHQSVPQVRNRRMFLLVRLGHWIFAYSGCWLMLNFEEFAACCTIIMPASFWSVAQQLMRRLVKNIAHPLSGALMHINVF